MKKEARKKYLKYFLNSLLGICIYLFYSLIFNGNHPKIFPATCITFFVVSYWMTVKKPTKNKDISISLLISVIFITLILLPKKLATNAGTLLYVVMMPLSELMGSWAKKQKLQFAYFPVVLVFVCLMVRPNAIHYFGNTDAFQNKKLPKITFHTLQNEQVKFDTEVTVVDLWSTTCGVCFEEFPIYEKLKQEFEGNKKVKFYSANVPLPNDNREKTINIIKELDYDYETVFTEKFETIRDSLGINAFPHLLIIKNDTIKYLGDMETDRKIVLLNTRDVIKNILE